MTNGWIKTENYAPWLRTKRRVSADSIPRVNGMILDYLEEQDRLDSLEHTRERAVLRANRGLVNTDVWELSIRASEAGACQRKTGFRLLGYPVTNPRSPWSLYTFWMGKLIEGLALDAMTVTHSDLRQQVPWVLGDGEAIRGKVDGFYSVNGSKVCVEVKSQNSFIFNRYTKTDDAMPDETDLLQGRLGALALDCDYVHIVYVSRGPVAGQIPTIDWVLPLDRTKTLEDVGRLERLCETINDSVLPPPVYKGKLIEKPGGERWPCGYCSWRETCSGQTS